MATTFFFYILFGVYIIITTITVNLFKKEDVYLIFYYEL